MKGGWFYQPPFYAAVTKRLRKIRIFSFISSLSYQIFSGRLISPFSVSNFEFRFSFSKIRYFFSTITRSLSFCPPPPFTDHGKTTDQESDKNAFTDH
jgi:hypothetical protein